MSDPSNHPAGPAGGDAPPVVPPDTTPTAEMPAVAQPAEPATGPVPPAAPPPPPPAAPPGVGWAPQPPPGPGWPRPWQRRRPLGLLVAVGVVGVLLGCLLGGAVTLVATHLHDGWHGQVRQGPVYGPRNGGPVFPGNRPGFPGRRLPVPAPTVPAPTTSPSG
jgi:hypothetical protein